MKLLLVDDEQLIREGLAFLLSTFDDIEVVGQAANGEEALALCHSQPVDIVLMDIRMPIMDGCEATDKIHRTFPKIKILILTTFKDDAYIATSLKNGASGYLLKNSPPKLIYTGLLTAMNGGVVLDSNMAVEALQNQRPEANLDAYQLTDRECEIIKLLADGFSNKEIGDTIFLTEGSVKNCITQILSKLDLKDRTQVVSFAFRNGLVK